MSAKFNITPNEVFPAIEKYMLRDGYDIVIDMEKSKGSHVIDVRTGDDWLDFYTFFASSPFGMNHPALTADAYKEKIFRAAINKVANSDIYTLEMGEFVRTFGEVALPEGFNHLFLVDYGTRTVRFRPALNVPMEDIARGIEISREAAHAAFK
jgi:L-lysine 6-transaminase